MKGILTYQNGPAQGSKKYFYTNADALEIREGQCHISCEYVGSAAMLKVLAGVVMLGQGGKHRVSGEIELRPGDQISLQETFLVFSQEPGDPPPELARAKKTAPVGQPQGMMVSRRRADTDDGEGPREAVSIRQTPARGAPVVIASRKPAEAAPPSDVPKPARWLFGFLPAEKQKNAYYQLLIALFLLIVAFTTGALVGSQTKIQEKPNTQLEPYIRKALYLRARSLGWNYPKLLFELQKMESQKARPLAVWWLTMPEKKQ